MFKNWKRVSSRLVAKGEEGKVIALITRQNLMRIKSQALRMKVWFKVLSKVERAIIDLTINCVEKVRSSTLTETISKIISKILCMLEESFMTRAEKVGRIIAEKLCAIAKKWGNKTHLSWKQNRNYIRLLGINALNTERFI
jgi:hypothetical protein